ELLKRAESLIEQNIHPTVITRGFSLAREEAERLLKKEIGTPVKATDDEVLSQVAHTAMGSKGVYGARGELARLVVKAVKT
ncbi:chaperonin beta subunit, partial [mine drainage metagenome]